MNQTPERSDRLDIGRQRVGEVYAKALLGALASGAAVDEVLQELGDLLHEVFPKVPLFAKTLSAPRVTAGEKIELLDRLLRGRLSDELLRFLKVVAEHGRMDCLHEIHQSARALRNEQLGVTEVHLATAAPLSDEHLESIKHALATRMSAQLELRTTVKPELIGGIVVRVGDRVYDASVAQQLQSLREEAVSKAVHQIRSHSDQFAVSS